MRSVAAAATAMAVEVDERNGFALAQDDKKEDDDDDEILSNFSDDEPLLPNGNDSRVSPIPYRPYYKTSRSVRCRCLRKIDCCTGFLGFLGILFLASSVVLFVSFRHIVEFVVRKNIVLEPDSQIYGIWKEPPLPIFLKVYFFNITNKDDFPWRDSQPVVEQLGPYVYREHWKRIGIRWHDNDTVSFRKVRTFHFEPSMSAGSEEDFITTVNMPVLAAASLFKTAGPIVKLTISSVFHVLHESFFVRKTVKELMFEGYDDPLIKVAREIFGYYPFNKFGLFYGKNATDDGQYTVFTGKETSSMFTIIDKWRGRNKTDMFTSPYCNMINGTDGSSFPPLLEPSTDLHVFIPDFCRSLKLDFVGSANLHHIPTYVYEPPINSFDNGSTVPGNECYCAGKCLRSGVYNASACQYGAPIFVSFPHFLHADPGYLEDVGGLFPNASLHSSLFFLEPLTGLPVKMNARLQVNAYIERIPYFSFFSRLKTMVVPLIWFDETAELSPELVDLIVQSTQLPFYYGQIVKYCLLCLGVVLGVASILYFVVSRKHVKVPKEFTPK